MTSATSSLAIQRVKDQYGQGNLASRTVKIKRGNGGKEKGTASAEHTTAPAHSACLAINACCECVPMLTCKNARCECRKAARACVTCRCLGQCSNRAPQTRWDGKTLKENAESKTGKREGKCKQRRVKLKENATPRTTQVRTRTEPGGGGEDKLARDRATMTLIMYA